MASGSSGEAGRDPFENHHERAPVRLAGCEKSHHSRVDCILIFCALPAARARIAEQIRLSSERRPSCTHAASAMRDLLADRFVAFERTWIDVSSGARVRLRFAPAATISEAIVWSDLCAERARLRHPLMNVLLDYGAADIGRTFEAYSVGDPIRAPGRRRRSCCSMPAASWNRAACRCLRAIARVALREVDPGGSPSARRRPSGATSKTAGGVRLSSGRPLGLILQPRAILESLSEALEVAAPGGTTSSRSPVAEGRAFARRACWPRARRALAGFVPVASSVLIRLPWLRECLAGRHLLRASRRPLARRTGDARDRSWLGSESPARGGTCCSDSPELKTPRSGARWIDSMGIAAMTSMVFVDGDNGPSHEELFDAARGASGRPGLFLERLRATQRRRACGAYRCWCTNRRRPTSSDAPASGPASPRRRPRAARRAVTAAPGSRRAADTRRRCVCWRGRRACSRPAGSRRLPPPAPSSWPGSSATAAIATGRWSSSSGRGALRGPHSSGSAISTLAGRLQHPPRARRRERHWRGHWHRDRLDRRAASDRSRSLPSRRLCGSGSSGDLSTSGTAPGWRWPAVSTGSRATTKRRWCSKRSCGLLRCDGQTTLARIEAWALLARTRAALGDVRAALGRRGRAVERRRRSRFHASRPRPSEAWRSFSVWSETTSRSESGVSAPCGLPQPRTFRSRDFARGACSPPAAGLRRPMRATRAGWYAFEPR